MILLPILAMLFVVGMGLGVYHGVVSVELIPFLILGAWAVFMCVYIQFVMEPRAVKRMAEARQKKQQAEEKAIREIVREELQRVLGFSEGGVFQPGQGMTDDEVAAVLSDPGEPVLPPRQEEDDG